MLPGTYKTWITTQWMVVNTALNSKMDGVSRSGDRWGLGKGSRVFREQPWQNHVHVTGNCSYNHRAVFIKLWEILKTNEICIQNERLAHTNFHTGQEDWTRGPQNISVSSIPAKHPGNWEADMFRAFKTKFSDRWGLLRIKYGLLKKLLLRKAI